MDLSIRELSPSEYPWDLLLLADPSLDAIGAYIHQSRVLAAVKGEDIVGVVVITALGEGVFEIKNVAVVPAVQGKGVGKKLLEEALQHCRKEGGREVLIGTGNSSLGQLALYQKIGFRIVGIERDFFAKNYPDAILENGIVCRDMIRLSYTLSQR